MALLRIFGLVDLESQSECEAFVRSLVKEPKLWLSRFMSNLALKAHSHGVHLTCAGAADGYIATEIENFLFFAP